jgi:tetratricopeptide (TPR) repeat protein
MYQHSCPRCQLVISETRRRAFPVICDSCGFVLTDKQEAVESKMETSFLKAVIGCSAIIVAVFMQLANWGDHALEIIPLKIGDVMGNNSPASKERMAVIALDLKKYDLAERLYTEIARTNPDTLMRLGKFQMSRAKYKEAAATFGAALARSSDNLDVRYYYARCLGETGNIDEAAKHYDYLLKSKPGTLQVTVVEFYVKHLLAANRLEDAKRVIESVQRQGSTVSQFMDTELKTIVEKIRSKS